ncbi:plasma membrane calcium [Fusarium solani]|nr:plasma membrane calcium [Fusarium solani]
MLELDTIIFNTFVWMQIFDEVNNRRQDNKFNIFEGIHRNQFFIFINCLMIGLQMAIIFVGSRAFEIKPGGLSGDQWAISLVTASMCLPWAIVVRLFPDTWFATIARIAAKPFMIVDMFLSDTWSKIIGMFKKVPQQDVESNGNAPVVVVSEALSIPSNVERLPSGHSRDVCPIKMQE